MTEVDEDQGPEPASETKEVAELRYRLPKLGITLYLKQEATLGTTTGTTLWLSAQILACYVQQTCSLRRAGDGGNGVGLRPTAIELGAGTGLVSLVLARLGWQVIATDVEPVLSTVLHGNVARNTSRGDNGNATARLLDWTSFDEQEAKAFGATKLVVTADTVYEPSLVDGLLRSINLLLTSSHHSKAHALLALERRDSRQIDAALQRARSSYDLKVVQVNQRQIRKAVDMYLGSTWSRQSWSDVEIWRASKNA